MHSPSDRLTWLKQSAVEVMIKDGIDLQPKIPSLLSQLLDSDVLNENSCILQCFQYIVDEGLIPVPEHLKKQKESDSSESEVSSSSESESSSESDESESSNESNDASSDESENTSSSESESSSSNHSNPSNQSTEETPNPVPSHSVENS